MKEIRMKAVAMAPINSPDKKQWVFHGKISGENYKVIIDIGDDQFRLIESENIVVEPCA